MNNPDTIRRPRISALLPADPSKYHGSPVAKYAIMVYLVVITVRSLIHVLLPDGGAHSIATIDLSVAGGDNIVGMFGQWGAIQLLLAGLMWVLILSYPGLLPLIIATLFCEPFLRGLAGYLKPIETIGTAPGAAMNWVTPPVLLVLLFLSLSPRRDAVTR